MRHQGGTWEAGKDRLEGAREAGKDYWDSLGGTREVAGRQERLQRAIWTCGLKTISDPITGFRVIKYLL